MSDDKFYLAGDGHEESKDGLLIKDIIYSLDLDVRELLTVAEIRQVFDQLTEAEKRMVQDMRGAILKKPEGEYYLILDKKAFPSYVMKYGNEIINVKAKGKK